MTISPLPRRVVALAIAFCLALTGCGSSDSATGSTTDKEPLTQSNFAKRMNKALVSAGSAQITQDRKLAQQDVTVEGELQVAKKPQETRVKITGEAMGSGFDIRKIGDAMYSKLTLFTRDRFAQQSWSDEPEGIIVPFWNMLNAANASHLVSDFKHATLDFEKSGTKKKMDGVSAQPYTVTVDTSKVTAIAESERSLMPDKIEYTVYIGSDDLPRKVELKQGSTNITTEFAQWGSSVEVDQPEKSQLSDRQIPGGNVPQGRPDDTGS